MHDASDISGTIESLAARAALEDAPFAEAYDAVPPERRALMKTCIARLFAWHAPSRLLRRESGADWEQGFSSLAVTRPRDGCILFFDGSVGPAALLAALLPALCAGVGEVLACHVGREAPPHALLAALELAGQERVLVLDREEAARLAALHAGPARCTVALGTLLPDLQPPGPLWRGPAARRMAVWLEGGAGEPDPDLDAVAFAHPEAEVAVMGRRPDRLPRNFHYEQGGFDELLAAHAAGVVVPASRARAALAQHCLVLGPGQEGCWVHPGMPADHFTQTRIAWTSPDRADGHGAT